MSKLCKQEVDHIAKLANLDLAEEKREKFSNQLSDILDFVDKLSSLDVKDIPPLNNVTNLENVFKEDEVKPSLTQEEALRNAPAKYKGFFKVKAVFK